MLLIMRDTELVSRIAYFSSFRQLVKMMSFACAQLKTDPKHIAFLRWFFAQILQIRKSLMVFSGFTAPGYVRTWPANDLYIFTKEKNPYKKIK